MNTYWVFTGFQLCFRKYRLSAGFDFFRFWATESYLVARWLDLRFSCPFFTLYILWHIKSSVLASSSHHPRERAGGIDGSWSREASVLTVDRCSTSREVRLMLHLHVKLGQSLLSCGDNSIRISGVPFRMKNLPRTENNSRMGLAQRIGSFPFSFLFEGASLLFFFCFALEGGQCWLDRRSASKFFAS